MLDVLDAGTLKVRSAAGGGMPPLSPGAVTDLAAWQGLSMAAFILALVEGHELSGSCSPLTTPTMPLLFML
ncbi:MAG: hypothetical protein ACREGD_05155 [Candidatus Saccharimonadales bacterium]